MGNGSECDWFGFCTDNLHHVAPKGRCPASSQVCSLQESQRDLNKDTAVSGKTACASKVSPKERAAHVERMEAEEQHKTDESPLGVNWL